MEKVSRALSPEPGLRRRSQLPDPVDQHARNPAFLGQNRIHPGAGTDLTTQEFDALRRFATTAMSGPSPRGAWRASLSQEELPRDQLVYDLRLRPFCPAPGSSLSVE
jgi:hypothetical protein